jgi:hypothetical protein
MKQLGLSIIVAIGLTLPAFANPPQLKGDYVWTYSDTCLVSPSGFSAPPGLAPNGAAALGQTYSSSGADTGIEHFNGDGTGFVNGGGLKSAWAHHHCRQTSDPQLPRSNLPTHLTRE